MWRYVLVSLALLLAAPAWSQTSPGRQPLYVYTCTVVDAVSVGQNGALEHGGAMLDFARKQSPFTLDTETGRMQRAAAIAAGISESLFILKYGSAIDSLDTSDLTTGVSPVVQIRVDLPGPPWRFTWQHGASSMISGLCERKPK